MTHLCPPCSLLTDPQCLFLVANACPEWATGKTMSPLSRLGVCADRLSLPQMPTVDSSTRGDEIPSIRLLAFQRLVHRPSGQIRDPRNMENFSINASDSVLGEQYN